MSNPSWLVTPFDVLPSIEGCFRLTRADRPGTLGTCQMKQSFALIGKDWNYDFDYYSWGGTGGDGFSVYLFDATAPNAGTGGTTANMGYTGVIGAYCGFTFNETEGQTQFWDGQAANYAEISSSTSATPIMTCSAPACTTRQQCITTVGKIRLRLGTLAQTQLYLAINNQRMHLESMPAGMPNLLRIGISATNGSLTNNHEIGTLSFILL